MDSDSRRPVNRLSREKSPYLLQHQFNPVDWFPWGEEAFAKARREDKPILLSIGYSTCHWCHVMERESFEDPEVGDFLRAHFVSIKVDREERPDVDKIYMTFIQAMTGAGGWPLNIFLAPDLRPFYGGTYFPPEPRHGRPGFLQLLERIHEVWAQQREQVLTSSNNLVQLLEQRLHSPAPDTEHPSPDLLPTAAAGFLREYDPVHGGFGGAPKFPRPSVPQFLLRQSIRRGDSAGVQAVLHTCERMAAGGMHDQLGGGFARYSVDAEWLVPHFEKMLYDNAQLLHLYLDAHLVSGAAAFAEVARGIVDYVRRDMTHAGGGFYSAEDADSEGQEGKFYCWTFAELGRCLTAAEWSVATRYFGLTARGNFVDHSHPDPLPDLNVLHVADPLLADPEKLVLASAIGKMRVVRSQRVRPHLDDKVLSSWNGMMLGALARAAVILDDTTMRDAACRNLAAVQRDLWDASTQTLFHRWREGEHDQVQLLEAYAHLLGGVLDLYETTLEASHLTFACALAAAMIERFYDREAGGFWQAKPEAPDLILQVKDEYDGAEPSGNSVAILSLLRLAAITGRTEWEEIALRGLRFFRRAMERMPAAVPHLLQALDWACHAPCRVVISGEPGDPRVQALLRAAHGVYHPGRVVLGVHGPVDEVARSIADGAGEPRAFVCVGNTCQLPTADAHLLREHLRRAMPDLAS